MSANNAKSARSVKAPGRPARTLAILLIALVAFGALAIVQGATSFKLGLDLRGGTSVTLQPRSGMGVNRRAECLSVE